MSINILATQNISAVIYSNYDFVYIQNGLHKYNKFFFIDMFEYFWSENIKINIIHITK